jgi:hypothetical protein
MTPKEKAKVFVSSFMNDVELPKNCNHSVMGWEAARQCALIAVEEILNTLNEFTISIESKFHKMYWGDVKKHIENL